MWKGTSCFLLSSITDSCFLLSSITDSCFLLSSITDNTHFYNSNSVMKSELLIPLFLTMNIYLKTLTYLVKKTIKIKYGKL